MCGRFTLRTPTPVLMAQFQLDAAPELPPRFNIAPTQEVVIVHVPAEPNKRSADVVHWGLIPSWAKDKSMGSRMINARAETVAEKPAFRAAFKRRRCLVLGDGYFEWKKEGKQKQPYYVHFEDDRPFAMAGLWEQWREKENYTGQSIKESSTDENSTVLETCTIITNEANETVRWLHDRMPVFLEESDYDLWLDHSQHDRADLEELLKSYSGELQIDRVSKHVNHAAHDDPRCIEIERTLFD